MSKIKVMAKNSNFCQKYNSGQKSNFGQIAILNVFWLNFEPHFYFLTKFRFLRQLFKISILGQNLFQKL